jgi:two-component system KDP operon response regulator KdpE
MYKLLIIDDDPTLRRFLGEFLQNELFEVVTASNGAEGLKAAYNQKPDLVVLDVMMPGMDGWEVAARLRELSDVPIILLTAKSSEADKLRGFKLGVDDYLTKPFSFAELTARIQAVLTRVGRSAGKDSQHQVQVGDLIVDLDKREVRRGEEIILLTPTEYRLLEYLSRFPMRAVSEAELVEGVWGEYRSEDTAALRRYIWLLRQKIEPDPTQPNLILTVRGFGYRLGAIDGN